MTNSNIKSRRGVTIIELMVVFAIMGFLATVALPNLFGVAEKTREKVDLMKLYYLRDALNKALIEDLDAFSKYTPASASKTKATNLATNLSTGLSSDKGATLFVIELHNATSINVQGSHDKANNKIGGQSINICELIGSSGTWYNALKEARFEGVADIVAARLAGKEKLGGETFTSTFYSPDGKSEWYRTAPKQPMFISKALNRGKENANTRYTMSVQWTPGNEGFGVEVFLNPHNGNWQSAFKSDHGVCFSTYGRKGCAKSN